MESLASMRHALSSSIAILAHRHTPPTPKHRGFVFAGSQLFTKCTPHHGMARLTDSNHGEFIVLFSDKLRCAPHRVCCSGGSLDFDIQRKELQGGLLSPLPPGRPVRHRCCVRKGCMPDFPSARNWLADHGVEGLWQHPLANVHAGYKPRIGQRVLSWLFFRCLPHPPRYSPQI